MDYIYIDLEPVGAAMILTTAVGMFFLCRYFLKKWIKPRNKSRLLIGSLLATLLLTPLIMGSIAAIQLYSEYKEALAENNAQLTSITSEADAEKLMDQIIELEVLKGKTKREIVGLFGITDTTNDKLVYRFSKVQKNKPYILEIQFENDTVVNYKKKD
jgi:hypothetical protein